MDVYYKNLYQANVERNKQWDAGGKIDLSFRGNELAGEAGEACNVIKKLERERLGLVGSRDTVEHLVEELCDVVICTYLIAMAVGVDITPHIAKKFNDTSRKRGLTVFMVEE